MSYLRTVLIGMYEDIIKKYDGQKVTDSSGTLKFENGKVYSREKDDNNKYYWKEYDYKKNYALRTWSSTWKV